jgi:hypothetical protein
MLEQMKLQQEVFGLKRMSLVFVFIILFLSRDARHELCCSIACQGHRRQNGILVVKAATVWSGTSNVAPPSPSRKSLFLRRLVIDGDAVQVDSRSLPLQEDAER